jgi:hypothetical protein
MGVPTTTAYSQWAGTFSGLIQLGDADQGRAELVRDLLDEVRCLVRILHLLLLGNAPHAVGLREIGHLGRPVGALRAHGEHGVGPGHRQLVMVAVFPHVLAQLREDLFQHQRVELAILGVPLVVVRQDLVVHLAAGPHLPVLAHEPTPARKDILDPRVWSIGGPHSLVRRLVHLVAPAIERLAGALLILPAEIRVGVFPGRVAERAQADAADGRAGDAGDLEELPSTELPLDFGFSRGLGVLRLGSLLSVRRVVHRSSSVRVGVSRRRSGLRGARVP